MPHYRITGATRGACKMMNTSDARNVCCVALELSQSTWVCAFSPPNGGRTSVHRMRAGDALRQTTQ